MNLTGSTCEAGRANPCVSLALFLCAIGISLGIAALAQALPNRTSAAAATTAQDWMQIGTTTLSEREHSAVAYNENTSQLIVFGGDNSVGVLNDTWIFSGTRWNRLRPSQSPPARTNAALVYDPNTHIIILFGGDTHTAPNRLLNDTCSFDGTTCTQLRPPPS